MAEIRKTLPGVAYHSPETYALDTERVFYRNWIYACRAERVARPGAWLRLEIAGESILVVRGKDEQLRAFYNVCRHRAGPLANCDGRGAKRLRCQYHGWTYALDGRLLAAPEMGDAQDFSIDAVRLPQARVAQWRGLVFVALGDAPPFAELVDGIDARVGADAMHGYAFARRVAYELDCDWKVYVDNYLEGYHVPHIHPELNRMLDYRSYVTELARWHSLQWSPLESAGELYGNGEALYYWLWPNTMLNLLPGRVQTNRVLPLAGNRCRVEFDFYHPQDASDAQRHERDLAFSDLVQREDIDICERVQRGLASGSYVAGRLNPKRESGVHHFHELLREAYRTTR